MSSGAILARLVEAANILIVQEKSGVAVRHGPVVPGGAERGHGTKMPKLRIRELIAPAPVYPGVDRLCGDFGKRV